MIPIEELLFGLDTKANSLANLKGKYIPDETKIEVLNLVQLKLVLGRLGINSSQPGMDSFARRYEDLQILQVPFRELTVTATGDDLNSYTTLFSLLPSRMIVPTDAYVLATWNGCKDRIVDITEIVDHNDIRFKLAHPHYKPDFRLQETIASISNDTIYTYGQPDWTITKLFWSYLRYPVQMDVAGYIHLDGTASTDVDCELEYYLKDELLNLAVEEIADSTGNQSQSQLSRVRTKENA